MKKLLFAAIATGTVAMGANAIYSIGLSPVSKGMGGTGVAYSGNAVDANSKNPSLLGGVGTVGKINVEAYTIVTDIAAKAQGTNVAFNPTSDGEQTSKAGILVLPEIGASYKFDDTFTVALTGTVYGGARTDYAGQDSLLNVKSSATLGKFTLGASYSPSPTFSFGVAPFLDYSALKIGVGYSNNTVPALGAAGDGREGNNSAETSVGVIVGAVARPLPGLTIGASLQPKVEHEKREVVDFDSLPYNTGALDDATLEEPLQVATGLSYEITDTLVANFDYRFINWHASEGYRAFGWEDQHVLAVGAQKTCGAWKFRAGYNYAKSPIRDTTGEVGASTTAIGAKSITTTSTSILNLTAFPGIMEHHVTAGVGYQVNPDLKVDLAFLYAPEKQITRSGSNATLGGINPSAAAYTYTAKVKQWAIGAGLSYQF